MVIAAIVLSILPFINALFQLVNVWNLEPEYSHGMLIPPIAAFLVWQQRDWLSQQSFQGSWGGLVLVAFGLFAWLVGELSTVTAIVQYAFLLVVYGIVLSLTGWKVFRRLWMPLLILVFMIPLPAFFSNSLSLQLQLISSQIGVWVIRLFGISVYLEGNVIDLGAFQLQVAEACNGLRYLFPLMTLAFILAYFFKAPIWKRVLLFGASIPIAILMNSFRIGVIGITVEYWGVKMAEGVLHDFEGWVVFMLSTLVLIGVATVLTRIGKRSASLRESLNFDLGPKKSADPTQPPAAARPVPRSFIVAAALAATASLYAFTMPPRAIENAPDRASLLEFPTRIGDWQGRRQPMERVYLDALQLDDYIIADYRSGSATNASTRSMPVNLYVAFYESQRKGHSVHSPRSCMPGGGWIIRSLEPTSLRAGDTTVTANRAVIELDQQKQIVYYWFQQRGRNLTNEYLVKWYIFWDALTRNRTDGALVRLTTPVLPGMDEAEADARISQFASAALPGLSNYVPN